MSYSNKDNPFFLPGHEKGCGCSGCHHASIYKNGYLAALEKRKLSKEEENLLRRVFDECFRYCGWDSTLSVEANELFKKLLDEE